MKNKTAGILFLGVCVVLAILLLTRTITIITSGIIFAVTLVALGLISQRKAKHRLGN